MVFVDSLGVVHAAVQFGKIELCQADQGLNNEEDVGYQAQSAVCGSEVYSMSVKLSGQCVLDVLVTYAELHGRTC